MIMRLATSVSTIVYIVRLHIESWEVLPANAFSRHMVFQQLHDYKATTLAVDVEQLRVKPETRAMYIGC